MRAELLPPLPTGGAPRPWLDFLPAANVPVICWTDTGIAIMSLNHMGEWRKEGLPHKPPLAWMPTPHSPVRSLRNGALRV